MICSSMIDGKKKTLRLAIINRSNFFFLHYTSLLLYILWMKSGTGDTHQPQCTFVTADIQLLDKVQGAPLLSLYATF